MSYIRTCLKCGHYQISNHPSTYTDESYSEVKCIVCKAESLDYGHEETEQRKSEPGKPLSIRHESGTFDIDTMPLHRVIEILQKEAAVYGEDAFFKMSAEWDGDTRSKIVYYRDETEKAKADRESADTKAKEARRNLYLNLKQEFGD